MKLGSIFHPFTQCCGAPAAPQARRARNKAIDAGKAQADAKVAADAKADAAAKADGDVAAKTAAAKADAVDASSRHGQATDGPRNAAVQAPRPSSVLPVSERPVAPPPFPGHEGEAPNASDISDDDDSANFEGGAYQPASSENGDTSFTSEVPHVVVPTVHQGPLDFSKPPPKVVIKPLPSYGIPPQFHVGE